MSIQGKIKESEQYVEQSVINCPKKYDETKRVLLIDADSISYLSSYFPETSFLYFPTLKERQEECKYRIRNKLQEIQNNVEEWYNIISTIMFVGGKDNFRYKIYPEYKANRVKAVKPELLEYAKNYLIELGAIQSHGAEADDYVIEAAKEVIENCVIATIDKDLLYWGPNVPFYDYRTYKETTGEFKAISDTERKWLKALQLVSGDATDNIKGSPGIGLAYCKKNIFDTFTDYQYIKYIFIAYLKSYKNDYKLAKQQMKMNYKLLKLHTQEEIKELNL